MSKSKMEVFLPEENRAEAESATGVLKTMDTSKQWEMLEYMRGFEDGINYARRTAKTKSA